MPYLVFGEDVEAGAVLPGEAEITLDHETVALAPPAQADHQLLLGHHFRFRLSSSKLNKQTLLSGRSQNHD
jgi:hypothetical protein